MRVLPIPISRKKNSRLELNVLPSNQTRLATVGSIMLSQKTIPGNFAAKILKTRRAKRKNKTKARGELFASDSQVVFAILITAKLTHIWRTSCLRIAWRISRMHDRKLNGCRQRLPFARHFIPRKCSLCSQGSIHVDCSDRLTMLVKVGKRVDLQPFKIRAGTGSRSQDVRLETSMRCSTSFTDTLWKTKNSFLPIEQGKSQPIKNGWFQIPPIEHDLSEIVIA